jgi:membrane associated rhomboid family serine protease
MGIHDRDYYRDEPARFGWFGGDAAACKMLIAINVVVYVAQILTNNPQGRVTSGITRWLELTNHDVLTNWQVWRLLTYGFCHSIDNVFHIVFNMWMLWMFGSVLEGTYHGSREFLRFYLTSIVASGLLSMGLEFVIGQPSIVIGASGGVLATMMLLALYQPHFRIMLLGILPVEIWWWVLLDVVFNLHPVLLQLGGQDIRSSVAHPAHLGGLLYGYLFKRFGWLTTVRLPRVGSIFKFRSRPNIRLYDPADDEDLDRRVDEVLAKISSHGESSLNDSERQLLKDASRRYKNR